MKQIMFGEQYVIPETPIETMTLCLRLLSYNIEEVFTDLRVDAIEAMALVEATVTEIEDDEFSSFYFDLHTSFLEKDGLKFEKVLDQFYFNVAARNAKNIVKRSHSSEEYFELNADDRSKVMGLIAEMRQLVQDSTTFDDAHRRRILKRIAKIEDEVLKAQGNFDTVLAGIAEIGETLGQFGKDVKPLTDRMQEIRKVTQSKTKGTNQLPAPDEPRKLPAPEDDDKAEDECGED
ncbi:hypothetical protein FIV00_11640 [Labrenzia sp. THAF82]|uniref:hypothetical protein n=1 Tax=Labrenzia sp. THAF82 TaxID=2587861 RepID=UPI001268C8A2|nr:hypothetical protein [Labrenzia sp. THAF82]QFT31132.1 hypothetical protein FIV00_11640 [Labrenzia sp. THAF82]